MKCIIPFATVSKTLFMKVCPVCFDIEVTFSLCLWTMLNPVKANQIIKVRRLWKVSMALKAVYLWWCPSDKNTCKVFGASLGLSSWFVVELCCKSSSTSLCQLSIHALCKAQLNILIECCSCSKFWMIYLELENTTHCKLNHRILTTIPKHLFYIIFLFTHIRNHLLFPLKVPLLGRAN